MAFLFSSLVPEPKLGSEVADFSLGSKPEYLVQPPESGSGGSSAFTFGGDHAQWPSSRANGELGYHRGIGGQPEPYGPGRPRRGLLRRSEGRPIRPRPLDSSPILP